MSDWHDVENNLAFPPRENITSNNLTENLVEGLFYYTSSGIERCHICTVNGIKEVVTPKGSVWQAVPSYDHFVELTDKVEEFKKDIQTLTNNYKLLEKEQAADIAHGQALVDEFGDFEALYEELQRLREENNSLEQKNSDLLALIAEGNTVINNLRQLFEKQEEELKILKTLELPIASDDVLSECRDLLDSKNKELESARWYQTIQNEDIAKLRGLLKESKDYIDFCCVPEGFGKSYIAEDLLTRINEALNV